MKAAASEHYKSRQSNCAQSVALAWRDKRDPSSTHAEALASAGTGRAPGGLCGALHAALELTDDVHSDSLTALFKEKTGGYTTCRDIRSNRALPCPQCVELGAELLEKFHKETQS